MFSPRCSECRELCEKEQPVDSVENGIHRIACWKYSDPARYSESAGKGADLK
jgi:hypothetical protein